MRKEKSSSDENAQVSKAEADEPKPAIDQVPEPVIESMPEPAQEPDEEPQPRLIKVVNTSRTTLTIKSQQSKLFPPGPKEELVTEEEAERWLRAGLVAVRD
jgi:hypothetical protein